MRVLVISDTHIPVVAKELPQELLSEARQCDCCFHAGDFIAFEIYEKLSKLVKTYGVCGNMDDLALQKKLPLKQVIELEGVRLGLIHGAGAPSGLLDFIDREFVAEKGMLDAVVFGHSHIAFDKEIGNTLYFNPGSPTDSIFAPQRTYGVLELEKGKITKRRIVKIG